MMPKAIPIPRSHLISDIDEANRLVCRFAHQFPDERGVQRILFEQLHQLQRRAAIAFGEINGWKLARRSCGGSTAIFDHTLTFRARGRICAIVAQPYCDNSQVICDAQRHAEAKGMSLHIPPHPYCSFHFPRFTQFIVFCSREQQSVEWLAEQIKGLAWSSASW